MGGLTDLQSGHTVSLCVKVGVRMICALSFGERKTPAADYVVSLETSSNWDMMASVRLVVKVAFLCEV